MSDQIIVFDFFGPFAFFRVPRTTRMILSYPFPPRTAIFGLISGILGAKRNSYWLSKSPLKNLKLGLEIINPGLPSTLRMNYENTKDNYSGIDIKQGRSKFYSIIKTKKTWGKEARGFTTMQKLQIYRNVKYRIYCWFQNQFLEKKFSNALKKHEYKFPPYLGNVNFFAEVEYIGIFPFKLISNSSIILSSIIPESFVKKTSNNVFYGQYKICFNVPWEYIVEEGELPKTYEKKIPKGINLIQIKETHYENYIFSQFNTPIEVELNQDAIITEVNFPDRTANICLK